MHVHLQELMPHQVQVVEQTVSTAGVIFPVKTKTRILIY